MREGRDHLHSSCSCSPTLPHPALTGEESGGDERPAVEQAGQPLRRELDPHRGPAHVDALLVLLLRAGQLERRRE